MSVCNLTMCSSRKMSSNIIFLVYIRLLIVSPVSVNNSLAVRSREEGVDGDLDAVDEEEAQAHEQLREGVVRI